MLELRGVKKSFHQKIAVEQTSFTVQNGEFLSILGPSGCGKTTLLRIIAGLETPDEGQVLIAGEDVTKLPPHKRNVHTVFQRYALFPHMNVFDNVAFGLRCKKTDEKQIRLRVEEMLELASLRGQGQRAVTTLSGGEQQRVALIRALVSMPKLLLLDEPLGALDLKLRLQLQHELVAIQRRVKTTFVFVTHDQQEALNMSDRIALMNKGRVVQLGTPQEIYDFPNCYFAAHFVGGINTLEGAIQSNDGGKACVSIDNLGDFSVELPAGGVPPLTGERRLLGLRPEKLAIFSRKPSAVENTVEGGISAISYLGTHSQFEVTLKNGSKISVFQQNTQRVNKKVFREGDRVFVGWQANQGHLFADLKL